MEVKKVLWLLFATSFCCGSEIPDFIDELIEDLKVKEPSQVHDVVLIRLGSGNKELTDKIAQQILQKNVVLMPPTEVILKTQRFRAASFVVIVSDVVDEVRIFFDKLSRKIDRFSNKFKLVSDFAQTPADFHAAFKLLRQHG